MKETETRIKTYLKIVCDSAFRFDDWDDAF